MRPVKYYWDLKAFFAFHTSYTFDISNAGFDEVEYISKQIKEHLKIQAEHQAQVQANSIMR